MARRKLSRQQQKRISESQKARLEKAKNVQAKQEVGELGPEQSGLVCAHYGNSLDVRSDHGDIVRCHARANLQAVVTGDRVVWCQGKDDMGVVVACDERRSLLQRPDLRGNLRPVAANLDLVFVVLSPSPETPVNLIDRYLAAAQISGLKPVLVLNKVDLMNSDHGLHTTFEEYKSLGYRCIQASTKTDHGMQELMEMMRGHSSVFVGQSGVGKSSLTSALLPDVNIATQTVSEATGKGRHTTTRAELYLLPDQGSLIDSPGIREFGLWHLDENDLLAAYPELVALQGHCKFRNCRHLKEPGCAVLAAVESGEVLERRYQSFIAIRDSLDEVDVREN